MILVDLIILGNQVVISVMETSVRHHHGPNSGTWVGLFGTCRTISFGLPPPILQCPGIRGEMGVHGSCIEVESIPCTPRTLQATEPLCSSHPLQLTISGTSLEQMPLLNCQFLKGYRERRLAHLVLSFITMGYVWQEGEAQPAEVKGKLMSVWSWGRSAAPGTCCLLGTTVFFWKMGPFLFFSLGVS